MTNDRQILNLSVKIDGIQYVLGRLRFNAGEFSYFFTYPNGFPDSQLNLDIGKHTSPLDHITWHNGRVHIKRKDNVAVEIFSYKGPLLISPPMLTPIYVESFYFEQTPCLIRLEDFSPWSGSVTQEILSLDSSTGFSVVFFLVPSNVSTPTLFTLQFADIPEGVSYPPALIDLCDPQHRAGRINVWENWDVVVLTTRFVQSTLSPIPAEIGPCRLPNYRNVPAALTDLMLQANGLAKPKHS